MEERSLTATKHTKNKMLKPNIFLGCIHTTRATQQNVYTSSKSSNKLWWVAVTRVQRGGVTTLLLS